MPTLLVVSHTVSPATQELLEAVLAGARDPSVAGIDVVVRAALTASPVDALAADGFLLGTPVNIGTVSGALKHFFDTVYYPCLETTRGRPYGLWVHGGDDASGAVRAVERITTGLGWRAALPPVVVTGPPDRAARAACTDLGGTLAATLLG